MVRNNSIYAAALVAAVILAAPRASHADWGFGFPGEGAILNRTMSVNAYGPGDGLACSLWFAVEPGNVGLGSWGGGPSPWTASCAPPAGGFTAGDAVLKIWKLGDQETEEPLITRNVKFQ
jgi:hypothetical protein